MNTVVVLTNAPDSMLMQVFTGKCGQLRRSDDVVLVPRRLLPSGEIGEWTLQKSRHENAYWLLLNGRRYHGLCFCSLCTKMINGDGGNINSHMSTHSGNQRTWTVEQQEKAFFLFLVRHDLPFSTARDPMLPALCPTLTYGRLLALLTATADGVKRFISEETVGKQVSLMVDGWSDTSFRRYLGIGIFIFNPVTNEHVYRFLQLFYTTAGHGAEIQEGAVRECLASYHIPTINLTSFCSDSASVNTALADRMNLTWTPCCCRLWNLVLRHFLDNCPEQFRKILNNINVLRCRTLWVEHLINNGSSVRNLTGYVPTRWCSVCACVESFQTLRNYIISFQRAEKLTLFNDADFKLVEGVGNLFARFQEVNEKLMNADNVEGLATVYECINAIYMVLSEFSNKDWAFSHACATAQHEIEWRFFRIESKFCCRLLFAAVLNVAHGVSPLLEKRLSEVLEVMVAEVDLFTGATEPSSPTDGVVESRYSDARSLDEIINDSPCSSDQNSEVRDEIHRFMRKRPHLPKMRFSLFWSSCDTFPHLQMLAKNLRSIPTNTVRLEATFSVARRILAWNRMRLSPEHASQRCILAANMTVTERVLGFESTGLGNLEVNQDLPVYAHISDEED